MGETLLGERRDPPLINRARFWANIAGVIGVVSSAAAIAGLDDWQFLVSNYTVKPFPHERYHVPTVFAYGVLALVVVLALRSGGEVRPWTLLWRSLAHLWPLTLSLPLAGFTVLHRTPPFALSYLFVLGLGWAAYGATRTRSVVPTRLLSNRAALLSVGLFIGGLTILHTRLQINFFEHFMLGHADIGHFTEELKNALAGRGLRCDSFENTRFGWHFGPLMYLLVPGYWFWPSPVYLMVLGALLVHLPAIPVYCFARRLSASVIVGWLCAVAWLLLPSVSRLVYGNTYGFQWNNVTMVLIAAMLATAFAHRWRWSVAFAVLLLLCRETASAAVLGWAIYLILFSERRRTGIVLGVIAVAYFLLCAYFIIPGFSSAERYERMDIFGAMGHSVGEVIGNTMRNPSEMANRLFRVQGLQFVTILLVSMGLWPLVGWRLALAALPTMLPLLLVQNPEWMSIKFWHHAPILPFMFLACVMTMKTDGDVRRSGKLGSIDTMKASADRISRRNVAVAVGLLVCSAMGHYLYGFSPISKAYEVHANEERLHRPDPRLAIVQRLRSEIPHDRSILVTERLAAHFTDYRRLYTARRKGVLDAAEVILLDTADDWDTSGLPQRAAEIGNDSRFRPAGVFETIHVFERKPESPPRPLD